MYISEHFDLKELVWKELYDELREKDMLWVLWRRFDNRFLMTIDQFRKDFGSTVINSWSLPKISWLDNQVFNYSCVRPANTPIGQKWSKYTTHLDWNTADLKVAKFGELNSEDKRKAYNEARQFIIDNPKKYPYVTVLESGDFAPTWVHISTGNFYHQDKTIRIVKPKL